MTAWRSGYNQTDPENPLGLMDRSISRRFDYSEAIDPPFVFFRTTIPYCPSPDLLGHRPAEASAVASLHSEAITRISVSEVLLFLQRQDQVQLVRIPGNAGFQRLAFVELKGQRDDFIFDG